MDGEEKQRGVFAQGVSEYAEASMLPLVWPVLNDALFYAVVYESVLLSAAAKLAGSWQLSIPVLSVAIARGNSPAKARAVLGLC